MRKFLAVLLSTILILSTFTAPAYAGSDLKSDSSVAFGIDNITALPGSDVSVSFTIDGEYEAHALTVFVRYDAEKLSVVDDGIDGPTHGLTEGDVWQNIISKGGIIVADATAKPGEVPFMAIMPTNAFSGSGTIFQMNFHVNEDVTLGTVIPLELEVAEFNYMPITATEPTPIPFTSQNGSIEVEMAPINHNVTFIDWDGTVLKTETVEEGSSATAPEAPIREGYTFIGWDVDFTNVQSDLTVTAQYEINTYTVTYTINGELFTTQTYEYGAEITAPEYDVPEGHTFSGWDVPETMPAENITLDAALVINGYTVTFIDWDGTVLKIDAVSYGSSATAPEAPIREGYTFIGWDVDFTNVQSDLTVTAQYEINTYTVTFVDWNGNVIAAQNVEYGSAATAPETPIREGYTFIGWDVDFTNVQSDLTVTAQYEINTYTVTYIINGELFTTQTYEYGAEITAPEYDVPEGHTFSGWDVPETMPAENITLDAALTVNTYTVTYTINGELFTTQTYEYGTEITAPEYDVPEGHTFSSWDVPETMPAENITIDAALTVNTYTVTYTINGELFTTQTYEYGAEITAPEYDVPEGHTFSGWDAPETMPAENITIDAALTVNTYTVTYTINGELFTTQTYEYGAEITAPEYDVPEGHTFSGWDVPGTMPAENITLDAALTINTYTVTFVDGVTNEVIANIIVQHGEAADAPEVPMHNGYLFSCWIGDYSNVTEDLTIVAEYMLLGDVNEDGEITTEDVACIMRYALGIIAAGNVLAMDFNCDGIISSCDALLVLRVVLSL